MTENDNKLFGLLGKGIGYSFSRNYFSKKFEAENLKHQYVNFDLTDCIFCTPPDRCHGHQVLARWSCFFPHSVVEVLFIS